MALDPSSWSFHAIPRRCYLLIASAEVAEFGRRAGLRIQWSNPWGFESPLSHGAKVFFLNGDQNEEKKRDPRLLEEKERTTASFGPRPHQAPATCAPSSAASEIGEAARNVDEIGPPRIVSGSHRNWLGAPAIRVKLSRSLHISAPRFSYSAAMLILASASSVSRWSVAPSSSRVC